jgi:hypothetical protein
VSDNLPLVQIDSRATGNPVCASVPRSSAVLWLQLVTLAWMLIECGASLVAAATAHSPALLAFGSDSLVELLSASVVLLHSPARRHIGLCRLEGSRAPLAHFVSRFTKALRRSLRAFSHSREGNGHSGQLPYLIASRRRCLAIYPLSW